MLRRCATPYNDQLAVERSARGAVQAFVVLLPERPGFIWDVSSGGPARAPRNGFARAREVYSLAKTVCQSLPVVLPIALWGFVFDDEQTRFDIDLQALSVGHVGKEAIRRSRRAPTAAGDVMQLVEDAAGLPIGVLEELRV